MGLFAHIADTMRHANSWSETICCRSSVRMRLKMRGTISLDTTRWADVQKISYVPEDEDYRVSICYDHLLRSELPRRVRQQSCCAEV